TLARNHSATPATLNVLYPPRNLRLQSFVESSQGTATILLCAVDSHPPARLALLRGGHPVASSPPRGGDSPRQSLRVSSSPNALRLEFREATEEDEGEYECQARSALGVTNASLTLRVQATRVLVRPSPEVAEGTEVTLTCQAPHAQPGTLYTWFKNGQWPGFVALLEPRGGRQAVLLCSADGVPPPDIAISRGQGHPPLATTRGPSDPRFEVRATPTSLRVGMAELEPGDEGLYLCSATNSRGSATASLRLQVPGEVSPKRPQAVGLSQWGSPLSPRCPSPGVALTVEPSQEVPEGTEATLSCSATAWGDKGVNYTWYRDGRWLWEGQSGSFVLSRVSSADAGSYQCRASGTWGTATSVPLSLSVLCECPQCHQAWHELGIPRPCHSCVCPHAVSPPCPLPDAPRAVSVSTFLESREGRGAIVQCTAESHPPSRLALHHRGHLVATSLSPSL
ncbi:SN protein, partial [Aegithalos caudatus]|nr:SN protein [Aegithalos caudatus]